VKAEMTKKIDEQLATYRSILADKVPAYNRMILEQQVPVIKVPKDKTSTKKR
jgi:hypothetical protein